jgi:hypothetical protein
MTTAELYEYWKDHYTHEGVEQGLRRALHMAYETRFGPMPDDVTAAVEATHDDATLSRWLQVILTGAPEDVAGAVRGSAVRG